MKTITIQIGNSDNKLSQQEWAEFINEMRDFVGGSCSRVFFFGTSAGDAPWQNACWVGECDSERIKELGATLKRIREKHRQDSAALTVGQTELI